MLFELFNVKQTQNAIAGKNSIKDCKIPDILLMIFDNDNSANKFIEFLQYPIDATEIANRQEYFKEVASSVELRDYLYDIQSL